MFWKSQGKTIIVSEHRLYYLRGLADRFIYLADGQVSHDYSAAEFEQLTEQQRSDMGLRTFALERLLPPVLPQQAKTTLALRNFHFAYKNEPETLHIMDCEIPTNRIVGLIGNNPLFHAVSAAWRSAVGRLSGTERNTVRKTG